MKRRIWVQFVVLVCAVIFSVVFQTPSYGFLSTLDTTTGAEIAALESGAISGTSTAASTASLSTTGATVSGGQFAAGSVAAEVGPNPVAGVAAIASLIGLTNGAVTSLQNIAAQKYCAVSANASLPACGGLIYSSTAAYNVTSQSSTSFSGDWVSPTCGDTPIPPGYSNNFALVPGQTTVGIISFPPGGAGCTAYGVVPVGYVPGQVAAFNSPAFAASRVAAVALLSPTDIQSQLTSVALGNPSDTTDPTIPITGNTDLGTFDPGGLPATLPTTVPNPVYNPNPNPTPTPTPSPSSTPTPNPTPTPTPSPSSTPTPSPTPSPSSTPTPTDTPSPAPSITPIPAQQFCQDSTTCENWLQHGIRVFSIKFPFDVFGDPSTLAAGDLTTCPTYTFFSTDFQLCPIRDAVTAMKFPAIAWFIMRTWHSI